MIWTDRFSAGENPDKFEYYSDLMLFLVALMYQSLTGPVTSLTMSSHQDCHNSMLLMPISAEDVKVGTARSFT